MLCEQGRESPRQASVWGSTADQYIWVMLHGSTPDIADPCEDGCLAGFRSLLLWCIIQMVWWSSWMSIDFINHTALKMGVKGAQWTPLLMLGFMVRSCPWWSLPLPRAAVCFRLRLAILLPQRQDNILRQIQRLQISDLVWVGAADDVDTGTPGYLLSTV